MIEQLLPMLKLVNFALISCLAVFVLRRVRSSAHPTALRIFNAGLGVYAVWQLVVFIAAPSEPVYRAAVYGVLPIVFTGTLIGTALTAVAEAARYKSRIQTDIDALREELAHLRAENKREVTEVRERLRESQPVTNGTN